MMAQNQPLVSTTELAYLRHGLFARHLDLAPLRNRQRGLVRCIFHPDVRESLSLDLDKGLFNCFGCGVQGGMRKFAALVGEQVDTAPRHPGPRSRSLLEEARAEVLTEAWRQRARLEPYRDLFTINDFIRQSFQVVDHARRVATVAGPGERVWNLLAEAARLETEALAVEAEADAILTEGRIG